MKAFPERERERFFVDAELAAIGRALAEAEMEEAEPTWLILATRLLALTGMRLGEVLGLEHDRVDLEAGEIRLRDRDAKRGRRAVLLSAPAIALLSAAPRWGRLVCNGPNGKGPIARSTFNKFWKRIHDRAGIANGRPHDLRHTAGTYAGQGGANAFVVRDLLGHATLAMTGRYVGRLSDPVREVAESVGRRVAAAMTGENVTVSPLRRNG